mgnify:CR=1 FL=1
MGKAIVVLNKKTNKVKHYEKITDAVKDLGFLDNQFYSALKGKTNKLTAAGYLVYEYAEYYELNKVREHNTNVKFKKYDRNTPVYMIDPYTNEILDRFNSVREAANDMGVNYLVAIRKCCSGIYKTAHGYKWEYVEVK